jgi:putative nucleotidyltransferase with HDIG domain
LTQAGDGRASVKRPVFAAAVDPPRPVADDWSVGLEGHGGALRAGYLPRVVLATLVVTVLPGLSAGALQGFGVIDSWILSVALAIALSMALAAAGSAWWMRRPESRDIVFADLMLWGWLRRLRTERRLASARWLLGRADELDTVHQVALLERLSAALEARDPYTHGHSRRVTRHSYRIARQLGLPPEQAALIRTAAAVHDVGKLETPRAVLNKPGRLTDDEFAVIKRHAVDGAAMVAALGDDELTAIVRHHHEQLDGGGYPDGLSGDEIPLGARIIAVADTFDALTSNRPYRSGCAHKRALDVLRRAAGKQLDPDAVAAFLSYYSGRRVLPWWSAVAAAPSRVAAWALGGLQNATTAPLGGSAAALGATFLVGAGLAGGPARGQVGGPAERQRVAVVDTRPAVARGGTPERDVEPASSRAERLPVAGGDGPGRRQGRSPPPDSGDGELSGDRRGGLRRLVERLEPGPDVSPDGSAENPQGTEHSEVAVPSVEAAQGDGEAGSSSGGDGSAGGGSVADESRRLTDKLPAETDVEKVADVVPDRPEVLPKATEVVKRLDLPERLSVPDPANVPIVRDVPVVRDLPDAPVVRDVSDAPVVRDLVDLSGDDTVDGPEGEPRQPPDKPTLPDVRLP